jgi:two-component system heavy metal sensor histidine kinase CusS
LLDVGAEVDGLIEYHRPVAEEFEVSLVRAGEGSLAADRTLFRRALSNLLSNALQASNRGGTVSVSISRTSSALTIAVTDKGIGISDGDLPRVFERFHRSREARARRPEGSGLGLAIVKSIVELHGGWVAIESHTGAGTCVSLSFPAPA